MSDEPAETSRGHSRPAMRTAECKDCLREIREGKRDPGTQWFSYPEAWATGQIERGGSRSDRCREHRTKHQHNIAGMAVAYIDLATVGEVSDRQNPTGPLGGLGALPEAHSDAGAEPVDLGKFGFGMDESHIRQILEFLSDPVQRVLIVKAGTGTGKSTYMPYRLLDPPDGCYRLIDNGPIIVTEPRVQATVGVAEFVGGVMSGAGGVGPGFPVGYQAGGDRQHDPACQLVFVTDGTMINWLREGRLSQIGTVIVDEAHERSTNIDFILGYLKRELPRYPHLRVIVTSATFNADFYQQYFDAGGVDVANTIDVPAVKSIGYGWPLFPELDVMLPEESHLAGQWTDLLPQLKLRDRLDVDALVHQSWPAEAPALKANEVTDSEDIGFIEDLHATTRALLPLRFQDQLPVGQWKTRMPEVLGRFVVELAKGLEKAKIYGDILGFLPTGKNIEEACEIIKAGVGDRANVFALLSSLPADEKRLALEARKKGDRRKIVVSTNLAETSLTVEGVRFVVDSGLIAQSEWDPAAAQGGIKTKPHSQAGIRQRWGRVGRKSPGWVFPLYTKGQLVELSEDTDPGSTRDNLEQLIMTAKLGGIDDVVNFDWPAAFLPEPPVVLDKTALEAREKFVQELSRANEALQKGGAVDGAGHPTSFGRELSRFSALGSASCAVAVMYADRLGCVPEVATILALLHERPLAGGNALLMDRPEWPDEWRYEAATRHRALASACEDDAELVLQLCARWERADSSLPPWEPSAERRAWARRWWVNDEVLRDAAEARREILSSLSPALKEEVKRFIEPALLRRARGAISRAMAGLRYQRVEGATYRASTNDAEDGLAILETSSTLSAYPERILPLTRRTTTLDDFQRLSNVVTFEEWALKGTDGDARPTGPRDAMRLLVLSAHHARPDTSKDVLGATIEAWPAGQRVQLSFAGGEPDRRVDQVHAVRNAFGAPDEETAAEEIASVVVVDEDDTAKPEDASPELDTSWPSQNPEEPDIEALAVRELLDSRDVEALEAACGACSACLVGAPQDCQHQLPDEPTPAVDVLEAWRTRATLGIDVSHPSIEVRKGEVIDGGWYEVVGYRVTAAGSPVVVVATDWRPVGDTRGAAEHPDLLPGDTVELIVGSTVVDHRDQLRVLHRTDGLGRFLLREAHTAPNKQDEYGQLAVSLYRRYQGLLDQLNEGARVVGTVVPRRQPGFVTVTLLELLQQHFDDGNREVSKRFEVVFQDGRTGVVPFYPGIVKSEPNRNGYIDVELLVADSVRGLSHGLSFVTDEDEHPAPQVGAPLWVRLSNESAKLSLREVELDPIQALAEREQSLKLPEEAHEDDEDDGGAEGSVVGELGGKPSDSIAGLRLGGLDSVLLSRRAVPRHVAQALVELRAGDVEWEYKVWRFWSQSRYLRTDRDDPYRSGDLAAPIEHAAEYRPELPPSPQISLDEAVDLYRRGSPVDATVTGILDGGHRAFLKLSDGTKATVTKESVGPRGVTDLCLGLDLWQPVSGTVKAVGEHRGEVQVELDLSGMEVGDAGNSPRVAADVRVPRAQVGTVIGRGGERIKRLRASTGVTRFDFDSDSATLRLEGQTDQAIRAILEELATFCEGAEGRMSVPGSKHGLLIGKGGEKKKRLLDESGCVWADPVKDSDAWEIRGASEAVVRKFVDLAAVIVPGCALIALNKSDLVVRDVSADENAPEVDWRVHRFG
jgi:HrpA-like RNA helicase